MRELPAGDELRQLKPRSTTQTATGINPARVVQKSMGMTGGSFNTREFFHGASEHAVRRSKVGFQVLAFALPILLLGWVLVSGSALAWLLALASQAAGLLAGAGSSSRRHATRRTSTTRQMS